ncbi:MAG: AI-2E family transporter [Desulfurivibrionaceae bacterium]|nr:AI-2E family transporter [Desulfobulbales bacterium]MDT8334831.1 AI-2E family transporter [Desulfurivibrionaceae bacterium]
MSNYLTSEENLIRLRRARIIYTVAAAMAVSAALYLLWALRELIVPTVIGMLMAYICLPLIGYLKNRGLSRSWAVLLLFGIFCLILFSAIKFTGDLIPDRKTELELQARVRYKLNDKFEGIMGLGHGGNWFYHLFGRELEPLRAGIDEALRISEDSHRLFTAFHENSRETGAEQVEERYWRYHLANRQRDLARERTGPDHREDNFATAEVPGRTGAAPGSSLLLTLFNAVSLWLITPLVFLILLVDDGKLKRELVHNMPNRYFEMTLTTVDNINRALGRYLRGTFIECFLVGTSFTICLFLIGLEMQWAAAIGIIAGLANAIPFLGPAIGLLVGVLYAVMAEEVTPLLPFIDGDNLLPAVLVVVAIVQLADNAIFQPYVLGGAVDLHPLIVVFGVMGGAVIFGFAGMLFAVPAIMIGKVVITTIFRQFRAYHII